MPDLTKNYRNFSRILLKWNLEKNTRQMPWKGETNPYRIWLSEIILQQTRVEQGWDYYHSFLKAFPDIESLAAAPDDKVFKLWEGLGYYSRCRNLLATARFITRELGGKFPDTHDSIRELKGVGPYTAAAIASFAYNLPHAVVDGNVYRVLSRVFGIKIPTDSSKGKKLFTQLADELLDKKRPGEYNQAIMDFGAVICKPAPVCDQCPFARHCWAYLNNKTGELPVKEKKPSIRKRWFYYFVIEDKGRIAIEQRTARDIWQQLYEFPMIEMEEEKDMKSIFSSAEKKGMLRKRGYEIISESPYHKQQLSHQLITGKFIKIKLAKKSVFNKTCLWPEKKDLHRYAFPKFINFYLKEEESRVFLPAQPF